MTIHNLADFSKVIEGQKRTLEAAKSRKGEVPRDRKPLRAAYSQHLLHLALKSLQGTTPHMISTTFVPPAYHPCVSSVAALTPITIRDLRLETHHRGRYILLKAVTPPQRYTGISTLMIDVNNDAVLLTLYQQETESVRPAEHLIDVDKIVLIKEPFYKVMSDGNYGIRLDHVTDIDFLRPDDRLVPMTWQPAIQELDESSDSLRLMGNDFFGKSNYWKAIDCYNQALEASTSLSDSNAIKRNRALAFLKTKQYDAVLIDAGSPQFELDTSEKMLLRAAEALYHLGRFDECCTTLEKLLQVHPSSTEAAKSLTRAQARKNEQRFGVYPNLSLQKIAKHVQPPLLDCATFMGPIQVRQTKSKGRGMYTTDYVKAGDLLLCEKAFSYAFANNSKESSNTTFLMNLENNTAFQGTHADLIRDLVQKLHKNPSLMPAFVALYHGKYRSCRQSNDDDDPVIDTFLVERIMSLNAFGCSPSTLQYHEHRRTHSGIPPEDSQKSTGIWIQASYINHDCIPNVYHAYIGDLMIVRASRDLPPDTEITFRYETRQKLKHWGIACNCALCEDAKDTRPETLAKRTALNKRFKSIIDKPSFSSTDLDRMDKLIDQMSITYTRPATRVPREDLWGQQMVLARFYRDAGKTNKSLRLVHDALTSLGFVIEGLDGTSSDFLVVEWGMAVEELVMIFLLARDAFATKGMKEDSLRAKQYAKTAFKILFGEDESFGSVY